MEENKVFDKIIFIAQICWLLFLKARISNGFQIGVKMDFKMIFKCFRLLEFPENLITK